MRRILILLTALAALLIGGCKSDQRNYSLTNTLTAYASVVRWGDFASAYQFVDPKVREAHPPSSLEMARYDMYKVTGYDEGKGAAPGAENEVTQVVQINMVNIHTQVERTVVDQQKWRYDPETKHWWLVSGLPDISHQ
ncbi:hypothetical protein ISN76_01875 [Dyella halodurans]|uniref:DUF4136 domain-containing protein n=1 Tax=Dyella halodurans TaxID=1920171 RepID=A0ABV9BZD0_9GAMM|nr:hypothetical protein [Dyella halodurans]